MIVDIVGVAIHCGVHRDGSFQLRRGMHGDLDGGDTTIGGAVHPEMSRAPRLGGQPSQCAQAVLLFLGGVFVPRDPFRGSGATDIEAYPHVSFARQVTVHPPISGNLVVIFAIRKVLYDRGEGSVVGSIGQIQCSAEPHAIRHGNLHVLDDANWIVRMVPLLHKNSVQLSAFSQNPDKRLLLFLVLLTADR